MTKHSKKNTENKNGNQCNIKRNSEKKDERSPFDVELSIKYIEIVHEPEEDYPISKKSMVLIFFDGK